MTIATSRLIEILREKLTEHGDLPCEISIESGRSDCVGVTTFGSPDKDGKYQGNKNVLVDNFTASELG